MYFILKRAYRYNNSSIETLHTLPHLYPSVSNTTSWASPNQNSFQATIQWVNKWPCHSNIKTHQESLGKKIQSLQCCHETKSWVQWNMGKSNWETQLGAFSNCFMILNSSNLDWFRWHVKYWWTISCTSWYGKIYENIPIQCRMMVCFDLNHSNMVSFTVFVPGASLLLKSTMNQFLVVTCNIPRCSTPLNVYCQKSNIVLGKYSISLIKIEFQTSYFVHHIYRYRYLYTYPLIKYCNAISQITYMKKTYLVYHYIYIYSIYTVPTYIIIIHHLLQNSFHVHNTPSPLPPCVSSYSFLSAPPTGKLDVDREIHHQSTCLGATADGVPKSLGCFFLLIDFSQSLNWSVVEPTHLKNMIRQIGWFFLRVSGWK